jgi:hypothetical protein
VYLGIGLLLVLGVVGCSALANMHFVSYQDELQRTIGMPISQIAAKLGTPVRRVEVGDEVHYTYLDGRFTPHKATTSASTMGSGYSSTTSYQTDYSGGDFVGCVLTFRVNKQTNLVVGALTEPHVDNFGLGGCQGHWVQSPSPR